MVNSMGEYMELPIDKIHLDVNNPRIAKWMELYGGDITAEQMSLALGAASGEPGERGPTFLSLKESIRTNGGIIHPILVNKDSKGKYTAIEGNTRTLIYKEFRKNKVPGKWDKIPAIVHNNLEPARIEAIRLQAHLVGPREWDPYSKARYLVLLSNSRHLTLDQIVDFCGGKKREVSDFIQAYHDMENYYRPLLDSDQDFDPTRFSAFVELQKARIKEALLRHRFELKDFAQWVIDGKLHPLHTVRQIPRILDNDRSREVFLRQGAQEAIKYLDIPDTNTILSEANVVLLVKELVKKINSMSYQEFRRLKEGEQGDDKDIIVEGLNTFIEFIKDMDTTENE